MSRLFSTITLDVKHLRQIVDFYQNLSIIIIVRGREKELPDERNKFLTNSKISDIINTKRTRTVQKTRKAKSMKKTTLQSLVSYLNGETVTNLDEIKAELEAELNKGKAKADANRELYNEYHEQVIAVLSSMTTPVTAQDIADETGIARGKIVYGLKNYWADEVVVDTTGKSNTYTLKV